MRSSMIVPLRFAAAAWFIEAGLSSFPWFVRAGAQVFIWARNPALLWIISTHLLGALCPALALIFLWRRQDVFACLALTTVAIAWLIWHELHYVEWAWTRLDLPRVALSVLTLAIVLAYSLARALRQEMPARSSPDAGSSGGAAGQP